MGTFAAALSIVGIVGMDMDKLDQVALHLVLVEGDRAQGCREEEPLAASVRKLDLNMLLAYLMW